MARDVTVGSLCLVNLPPRPCLLSGFVRHDCFDGISRKLMKEEGVYPTGWLASANDRELLQISIRAVRCQRYRRLLRS